jgi:septal ring factor EnvC (AmiA/AmiB activator)
MKAVILEINDGFVAALSDDGSITKEKNKNYKIGQVINMKNSKSNKFNKIAMWASSAAAFVLVCGVGAWAYVSPYTYVSLDVNPSIEYSVNRFDRVLNVKAVNDDGEELLKEINLDDLTNKSIEDALKITVNEISEAGYFSGDIVGGIIIATSADNTEKAEELAEELKTAVEEQVIENEDVVEVEAITVENERVLQAKELGVTPGKLNLVEKLQASAVDPSSINIQEWLNKPVKDIMKATKENKKAAKEEAKKTETDTATKTTTEAEIDKDLTAEQQKELEKIAEKLENEKVKAAEKAAKDAEKVAKDAEKAANEAAKEAEKVAKEAEKAAKEAQKAVKNKTEADDTISNDVDDDNVDTEEDSTDEKKDDKVNGKDNSNNGKNSDKKN